MSASDAALGAMLGLLLFVLFSRLTKWWRY